MSLLALDNISVSFGGVAAVRGVSMQVARGEIRGLIGPNGAGKTSLINAITGIVRSDRRYDRVRRSTHNRAARPTSFPRAASGEPSSMSNCFATRPCSKMC